MDNKITIGLAVAALAVVILFLFLRRRKKTEPALKALYERPLDDQPGGASDDSLYGISMKDLFPGK